MFEKLGGLSILYGLVSYWNWKELQLYLQYAGYRPINFVIIPYLGGTFRNFGTWFIVAFILYSYPFPTSLLAFLGCALGYFIGGLLFDVCMPFSALVGRYAIIFYILLICGLIL